MRRTVTYGTMNAIEQVHDQAEIEAPSARQREVLDAALRVLVREGGRLTMSALAAEANCSKETLYRWYGDRAGLLNAIVRWQAAQVRVEPIAGRIDRAALVARLKQFAGDWLRVVSGETSIALNRLARVGDSRRETHEQERDLKPIGVDSHRPPRRSRKHHCPQCAHADA